MNPPALDVSHLLGRAMRAASGGIDRVELAMARRLLREAPFARLTFTDRDLIRAFRLCGRPARSAMALQPNLSPNPGVRHDH